MIAKTAMRAALACCFCLVLLVAVFLALQAIVLALTDDHVIAGNLRKSIAKNVLIAGNYPTSPYGHWHHQYDLVGECLALGTNLLNTDRPLLYRLAATPHLAPEPGAGRCGTLVNALMRGPVKSGEPYFRYWHGHQIYLRPLLSIMTLDKIRIINALLLVGSLTLLALLLVQYFGWAAAPAFVVPLLIGTDLLTVPALSVHTLELVWIFLSVVLSARVLAVSGANAVRTFVTVFAAGAVTSYFDLLFSPVLAAALIAFIALRQMLSRPAETVDRRHALATAVVLATFWFAGFALAQVAKWIFSAIVLGFAPVVADITRELAFRIGGDIPFFPPPYVGPGAATWIQANKVGLRLIVACWGIAVAILTYAALSRRVARGWFKDFTLLLLPLILPVLWVELLRNHSIIHNGFVSRSFVLFAVLPLLAALAVWCRPALMPDRERLSGQSPHPSSSAG